MLHPRTKPRSDWLAPRGGRCCFGFAWDSSWHSAGRALALACAGRAIQFSLASSFWRRSRQSFGSLDVFARSSFWCRSRQNFGWLDVFARTNFWRRSLDVFTRASIYTPWPDCNTNKTLAQMAFNLNVPVLDLNEPVLEDIGKLDSFLGSLLFDQ